jgi:hypothetical protein
MAVPYTFGTATASIPLSQLDSNFATAITLGNTAVYLGNTTTSIGNLTLTNVTVSSVSTTFPNSFLANSSVTIGSTSVALGATSTTLDSVNIGATTAGTGAFTTLSASSTTTLSGGTANGVAYLNASKVLTTGSALTFDGSIVSNTGVGFNVNNANALYRFQNGSGTRTGYFQVRADAFEIWSDQSAVPMVFGTSNTEQMRLTSTGLGIGTSSPQRKLDIYDATAPTLALHNSTSGTGATDGFLLFTLGADTTLLNYESGYMAFATSNTERMRLDSSGNVGIGTSSPTNKLTVISNAGTLANASIRVNGSTGTVSSNSGLWLSGNQSTTHYNWLLASQYNVNQTFEITPSTAVDGATFSNPVYSVSAGGLHKWFYGTTQSMTLDTSGNLGIGTTSPSASAILDAQSTTKGVRMPNMTTTQKNAIASPAAGLMVFDTTLAKLCVYSGSAWQTITSI